MPFYPWLRRLALDRLAKLRRFHLGMSKRNVNRERSQSLAPSESMAEMLIDGLVNKGTSPSGLTIRAEDRERVEAALEGLTTDDHRILRASAISKISRSPRSRPNSGLGSVPSRCHTSEPWNGSAACWPPGPRKGIEEIDPRNTPNTRKKENLRGK